MNFKILRNVLKGHNIMHYDIITFILSALRRKLQNE